MIQTFYRITFFQLIVFCLKLTVKFTPACEGRFFSAYVFTINTFRVGHTFVAVTMSQGNPASRQMFHLDETITLYPVFTLFTSPTCSPLPLNSSPHSNFYTRLCGVHAFPPGGDRWAHFYSKQQTSERRENIRNKKGNNSTKR